MVRNHNYREQKATLLPAGHAQKEVDQTQHNLVWEIIQEALSAVAAYLALGRDEKFT